MAYGDCVKDANLLLALTPAERRTLLKSLDKKRIKSISECAHNLLRGNIRLGHNDRAALKKLRKHRALLRRLAARGESWVKKRRYLVQKGGGFLLPLLLGAVVQTALNLATR